MAEAVAPPKSLKGGRSFVIKDFDSLMKSCKSGEGVGEFDFKLENKLLGICVFPNGITEDKGWVGVSLNNLCEGEVMVERCEMTMAGRTWVWELGQTLAAKMCLWLHLTQGNCRASLKSGALELRLDVELAREVGSQETIPSDVKTESELEVTVGQGKDSVKKVAKKTDKSNSKVKKEDDIRKNNIEVEDTALSKKGNIGMKEETELGYHQIVIDLRVCHLKCSVCRTRPLRCHIFQCSEGHLVCQGCLPSIQNCAVCGGPVLLLVMTVLS